MTTETTGRPNGFDEKWCQAECCTPQRFADMMARCGEDMKCECGAMMQEMMKGGCCPPKEK